MPAAVVVTAKYGCCEADTQPNTHRQQNSSMSGEHDLPAYPVLSLRQLYRAQKLL